MNQIQRRSEDSSFNQQIIEYVKKRDMIYYPKSTPANKSQVQRRPHQVAQPVEGFTPKFATIVSEASYCCGRMSKLCLKSARLVGYTAMGYLKIAIESGLEGFSPDSKKDIPDVDEYADFYPDYSAKRR